MLSTEKVLVLEKPNHGDERCNDLEKSIWSTVPINNKKKSGQNLNVVSVSVRISNPDDQ